MGTKMLTALLPMMQQELDTVVDSPEGIRAELDTRYGAIAVGLVHDEEVGAIRVQCVLPSPPGAGADFLIWCLSTNVQYWDVKIGLDENGFLVIHADVEAESGMGEGLMATELVDRIESIAQLLDEDLVEYLLDAGLGTPSQQERWRSRLPAAPTEDE